jgi:hypothetical protein
LEAWFAECGSPSIEGGLVVEAKEAIGDLSSLFGKMLTEFW